MVVKGHSAHPGTSEIVAEAIHAAIKACNLDPGVFSLIQGGKRDVGTALVQHPLINAVGFTGSLGGGRALFDLCAQRETPIPFFGELGSVNPMFILPAALENRGDTIGSGWAGSMTMGAGQFCTKPGIAIVLDDPKIDALVDATTKALDSVDSQTMLTDGIADAYRAGRDRVAATSGIRELLTTTCDSRNATPYLYEISGQEWLGNETLAEEVFGPLGIIVRAENEGQMIKIANSLAGQLTCTLHLDAEDTPLAEKLMPVLERKAAGYWPTVFQPVSRLAMRWCMEDPIQRPPILAPLLLEHLRYAVFYGQ